MSENILGQVVVPGQAEGKLLISDEPISFWGGYDQNSGEIIDRRHPLSGEMAAGCVLALPFSRGSSTGTAVLLEAIRNGKAPAAIITTGVDTFFALASIVAKEMYATPIPIIALTADEFNRLKSAERVEISRDGDITFNHL
jgi:predicted aconitase with swiveling domain